MKTLILLLFLFALLALVVFPWAVKRQVARHHQAKTERRREIQRQHQMRHPHTPTEGIAVRR